ncbi:MAG: hypothetical protein WC730_01490 [Patescibacteria group bacterium]
MIRFIAFFLFFVLSSPQAYAGETFHPSRVRLLIHGGYNVGETTRVQFHFIPAGNLLGELAPLGYLGLSVKPAPWLGVEPVVGWAWGPDEPIASIRLAPDFGPVYGWFDGEIRFPSYGGYWFGQMEYRVSKWLHTGIEGEGWGDFDDGGWSQGGGVNVLGRFEKTGLDLAIHVRDIDSKVKPEFVLRFHLFL